MQPATLIKIHQESPSIRTFYFSPDNKIDYLPGQFIEMFLPHHTPDDRGKRRYFTLSSSPTNKLLSITTRYAGDEQSSTFKHALFSLKPGETISISEPMGDFVLPKDKSRPLLFFAGGIGLTPFHAMVSYLHAKAEKREITFLYAVRNKSDAIFLDTFSSYGINPIIVTAKIDAADIFNQTKPSMATLIYISGPEPMIEMLENELLAKGIQKSHLVLDFFPGYKNPFTK
jgi:ferredoxin-NADP reductase